MLEQLGRLGRPGDSVSFDSWRLVIVQADPNRIRRLRLEPDVQPEIGQKESGV